jgi:hypothetical protein
MVVTRSFRLLPVGLFISFCSAAVPSPAYADCVTGLASCATRCDQHTKPDPPYRVQCAQSCVAKFQFCRKSEQLGSGNTNTPGDLKIAP